MIRIKRPKRVPAVLKTKGEPARKAFCDARAAGKKGFKFDNDIYGHRSVKAALIKAQHEKCCFCESVVTHVSNGHIEHFRPKGGVRQREEDALKKPGYFWLAYEWKSLLFSCEICNSRYKKNLFPLTDPDTRASGPDDDISMESPLFVDPADGNDPAEHIGYREEYTFAVDGSIRGETTRIALGLDRELLAELRRDHLRVVKTLNAVRNGNFSDAMRSEASELLKKFESDKGQWSAMVRAVLRAMPSGP